MKYNIKKNSIIILLFSLLIGLSGAVVMAINNDGEGYDSHHNTHLVARGLTVCNASGSRQFIPIRHQWEFDSLRAHLPAGLSVVGCTNLPVGMQDGCSNYIPSEWGCTGACSPSCDDWGGTMRMSCSCSTGTPQVGSFSYDN